MTEAARLNSKAAYIARVETGGNDETKDKNEDETHSTVEELKALAMTTAVL